MAGKQIAYNADAYPYFFIDTNGDGKASEDEAKAANQYDSWTGRLMKAAYNYQVSVKDPGAFAHGGKYVIELLYDSIADLNQKLSTPVDLSKAHRLSAGHFAGADEQFRHWDGEAQGLVPGTCAKCHTATGLPQFLKEGVNITNPASNGLNCATCHNDLAKFTRYEVNAVKFPSGASITFGDKNDANLCINCHQGRESKVSVDKAIGALKDDEVSDKMTFRNPHYFAAGATLFGTQAKGAYEYDGQQYNGAHPHVANGFTCTSCHDTHLLTVQVEKCSGCHPMVKTEEDLQKIRMSPVDFLGDKDTTQGIAVVIQKMADKLYAALQKYAKEKAGKGIVYSGSSYPYFFTDTNDNGQADADELDAKNAYATWTPRLLRAAYNYQWVMKDPGAFAHNGQYILQILYDSLKDVGGDVVGLTRPPLPAAK